MALSIIGVDKIIIVQNKIDIVTKERPGRTTGRSSASLRTRPRTRSFPSPRKQLTPFFFMYTLDAFTYCWLVVITPGCGFVLPNSAVIIGVLAGLIPYFACTKLKGRLGYDDALDTFGVHAVGGTLGAFLTGVFASVDANANLATNLKDIVGRTLWIEQLKAIVITLVLAVVATAVIAYIVKALVGLRPELEAEREGLDVTDHGESAYNY